MFCQVRLFLKVQTVNRVVVVVFCCCKRSLFIYTVRSTETKHFNHYLDFRFIPTVSFFAFPLYLALSDKRETDIKSYESNTKLSTYYQVMSKRLHYLPRVL